MTSLKSLTALWSTTRFPDRALTDYAQSLLVEETRRGVMTMSFVSLVLLVGMALLYTALGFGGVYSYTNVLLATLSLHIFLSARVIREIRVLHLLGMTLLTISGVAFVLLAHRTGTFSTLLLSSAVLLFMVVPMVPWGLREALTVVALVYAVFTLSTLGGGAHFDEPTLWTLQFVMLGASLVTLILVARGTGVRRDDIAARYELEGAHRQVELLSLQDPLTGAWNRRYLQARFPELLARAEEAAEPLWFVLLDLDDFKRINDSLGHDRGDQVLRWLAAVLRTQVDDRGVAVRMGGDEFALVFTLHSPRELMGRCVEAVNAMARQAMPGGRMELALSAGVVALPPGTRLTLDEVYQRADAALYAAKEEKGRDDRALRLVGPGRLARGEEPWAETC